MLSSKRVAFACCAFGLMGSALTGQAIANPGESVQLELVGSVEPRCAFVAVPGASNLGPLSPGAAFELGELAFRCNLPDSPTVHLSVQSEHGALTRDGGTEKVPYTAQWNVPGGGGITDAASLVTPVDFTLAAGDIVAGQSGMFKVTVGGAGVLAAGTYRDRITYTISP